MHFKTYLSYAILVFSASAFVDYTEINRYGI